jgi:DNA polymerase III delta prime subunit
MTITKNDDQDVWAEKYRPRKIDDVIIPARLKKIFKGFVDSKEIPNLTLVGSPGTGKSTIAKALLDEIDCNWMLINGSLNLTMDALRTDITGFASTVSFKGGRKAVIIDEADNMDWRISPALRSFFDSFAANCGFILTANKKNKILPALQSRGPVIDFSFAEKDKPKLCAQFFARCKDILSEENVKYDEAVLAKIINFYYPDWRRVLGELQIYAKGSNEIDSGMLSTLKSVDIEKLIPLIKDCNFTSCRKWVADHSDDIDFPMFAKKMYDDSQMYFTTNFLPELTKILQAYEHDDYTAVNKDINLMACISMIMSEGEWK